jgi:NitT/TauT family transport system ATP-binding protein
MPRELSAGMKKRVELARALFADPEVILADEPFSSLDQITRGEIHRLILDLQTRRPRTVVFSTHDVDEALYLATMIIVLRQERATVVSGMFSNSYACKPNARTDDPAGYQEIRQSILGALDGKVG